MFLTRARVQDRFEAYCSGCVQPGKSKESGMFRDLMRSGWQRKLSSTALVLPIVSAVVMLFFATDAFGQTEAECLQSFNVKAERDVTYIGVDAIGNFKIPVTTSCLNAELFREKLFVSMNKNQYLSEIAIRSKLADAKLSLSKLRADLQGAAESANMKALVLGSVVVVSTTYAISTTLACASAVVDGVGIVACGPAARASVGAVAAWAAFQYHAGSAMELKTKILEEIKKHEKIIEDASNLLTAAQAVKMKDNYSALFVGICRAVKQQCL